VDPPAPPGSLTLLPGACWGAGHGAYVCNVTFVNTGGPQAFTSVSYNASDAFYYVGSNPSIGANPPPSNIPGGNPQNPSRTEFQLWFQVVQPTGTISAYVTLEV
jgi:hypothetical protein